MRAVRSFCLISASIFLLSTGQTQPPEEMPEPTTATNIPRWRPFIWGISSPPLYPSAEGACTASFFSASSNDDEKIGGFSTTSHRVMVCRPTNQGNAANTTGSATLICPSGTRESESEAKCIPDLLECTGDNNPLAPTATSEPIHIASGGKMEFATDFQTNDGRLAFRRIYTTQPFRITPLGWGWQSNFDRPFNDNADPTKRLVDIQLGSGLRRTFVEDEVISGVTKFVPARYSRFGSRPSFFAAKDPRRNVHDELEQLADGTFILTLVSGQIETYSSSGRLLTIDFPGGYSQTLNYSADKLSYVEDSFGRRIDFSYKTSGLLETVTDPDGDVYEFSYTNALPLIEDPGDPDEEFEKRRHVLTSVILPDNTPSDNTDNPVVTYHYEHPELSRILTGITDERGIRTKTTTYDGVRAIESGAPNGDRRQSVNRVSDLRYDVTNPLGAVFRYDFKFIENVREPDKVTLQSASGVQTSVRSSSRTNYMLSEVVDQEGYRMGIDRGDRGLPTITTLAEGTADERQVSVTWHPDYALPTQIVEPKRTTTYTHDADGNVLTRTETDTSPAASGQRVTSYTYLPGGLLSTMDGPLPGTSDTYTFGYTTYGYLSSVTDPNGLVTSFGGHNGRGEPATITEPNGLITALEYDNRGRLTEITENPSSGSSRTTTLTRDDAGNVTRLTLPEGGYYDYAYDVNNWITSVTSSRGEVMTLNHDAMGNITSRTISGSGGSFSETNAFDVLGRLISTTNGAGDTTTYSYDKRNQMTGIIDPESNIWGFSYDGLGRLIRATDPELDETESNYDSANDMTSFDDGRNLTTTFQYNGFGEVTREISPDRGTRDYTYDRAGRLTSITTADGDVEQRGYDAGGRLTSVTFPGSPTLDQTMTYDATTTGRGYLTGVTDTHGAVTYVYDIHGDLTSETRTINGQTYVTSYEYNKLGQPTRITYPSGLQVDYDRDTLGRLTRITTVPVGGSSVNIATNLSWLPMGPLKQYTSANDMVTTRSYNSAYQLTGFSVADGSDVRLDKTIGRDGVGRITSIGDAVIPARSATYEYTDDGRLERAVGIWGEYQWSYDAVGNRLSESEFVNFVEVSRHDYAYGVADNRLIEVSDAPGSVIRSFAHRAGGDMTADTNTLGDNYTYDYDGSGRLKTVRKNGAVAASYGYDAFERRVTRTIAGVADHYIFEASGRPLAEHTGATGAADREYIWLEDMLVAVVQGGSVYAIHGGHLGQPLIMTDELANEVWNAEYAPFGGVLPSIDFDDPELRYPGQWADGETILLQNWHRDYDPSLGRYIEADPLGLAAGQSLYGYTYGDPINLIDPDGRHPLVRVGIEFGKRILPALGLCLFVCDDGDPSTLMGEQLPEFCPVPLEDLPIFNNDDAGRGGDGRRLSRNDNRRPEKKRPEPKPEPPVPVTPPFLPDFTEHGEARADERGFPSIVLGDIMTNPNSVSTYGNGNNTTVIYSPQNDVTVIISNSDGRIVTTHRGLPTGESGRRLQRQLNN